MRARSPMTDDERALWRGVFASAFVGEFESHGVAFDEAAHAMSAERAITIADLAIVRLREWRRDEKADVGEAVDLFHAREP